MTKPQQPIQVYISYSERDRDWLEQLTVHLLPLKRSEYINLAIAPDSSDEAVRAIEAARMAIALVSADFLASDWIAELEMPKLLNRRRSGGLPFVPILVRPCIWEFADWFDRASIRPKSGRPLSLLSEAEAERELADVAREVLKIAEGLDRSLSKKWTSPQWPAERSIEDNIFYQAYKASQEAQLLEKEKTTDTEIGTNSDDT